MSAINESEGKCPFSSLNLESGAPTKEELLKKYGRDVFSDFDFDDPVYNTRHYEIQDDLLKHCPVARSNVGKGYWIVSRNKDVRQVAQNWKVFSSAQGYQPNRPDDLPYLMPEESDPPMHTSWRNVLNPHLSPNRVLAYDDIVRKDVNTLIDRFIANGKCEFISELGSILPGWAFFKNVLGVPVDDLNKLVASVENGTFAPVAERGKHFAYIFEYLDSYLRERQELPPRGDLVDTILEGVCYEDGSQAPWEHKVSILVDITFGGIATTTYVMASGIHFLATHQEDREALLADPSLMDSAIEEFVRVFPPVVSLGRTCTEDVEVNGVKMKSGDFVMINYAASSRDPRVVDHADTIDIRRKSVLHTAFGAGPHRCIGSHLARVELRATFEEWLKRIPEFKLAEGTEPVFQTGFLRSMRELHLEF